MRNLRHELVHELAHALVAAEGDRDDLTLNYAQEELVVESVTYTVAGALGLRVDGYAIPYLASGHRAPILPSSRTPRD